MLNTTTLPQLPSEVEHTIFAFACENQHPRRCVRYLSVSREVRKWVEAFIYRVVLWVGPRNEYLKYGYPPLLEWPDDDDDGQSNPTPTAAFSRNANYTRSALLQGASMEELHLILDLCTNCTNLAIWCFEDSNSTILDRIRTKLPHLKQFSGNIQLIARPPPSSESQSINDHDNLPPPSFTFDPTPFPSLVYLDIIGITEEEGAAFHPTWTPLSLLPKLTHLSIEGDYTALFVTDLLSACPHLITLVLFGINSTIDLPGHPGTGPNPKRVVRITSTDTKKFSPIGVWEREQRGAKLGTWYMAWDLIKDPEATVRDAYWMKWDLEEADNLYFARLEGE